jgi:ABC-2 type transport system ATP-binding protein
MSSNEGFFELQCDDNSNLKLVLSQHAAVDKIAEENGKVLVYLKSSLEASELNRFLFEKNISLNHLVKRKNSLEEQFLELTKNR